MKRYLFVLLLSFTCFPKTFAQPRKTVNYRVLNQAANTMLYDSFTSKILITTPSSDAVHGNSIGFVNPDSATLSANYFVGSNPSAMDMTEDGRYVYIGMQGSSLVERFDMNALVTNQSINLGSSSFFGPKYANSISCQPGSDSVISVVAYYRGVSPPAAGVFIFKNGQQLHDSINQYKDVSEALFLNSSTLYGFNNITSGYDFYDLAVNSNGVTQVNDNSSLFSGFNVTFFYTDQYAISNNGTVANLSGGTYQIATFNLPQIYNINGSIAACYDPYMHLACFAYNSFGGDTIFIDRFSLSNFLPQDRIVLTGFSNGVTSLISWGDSTKLALSTSDGKLVIINGVLPCADIVQNFSINANGNNVFTFVDSSSGVTPNMNYEWTVNGDSVSNTNSFTYPITLPDQFSTICETIHQRSCPNTGPLCKLVNPVCTTINANFIVTSDSVAVFTFSDHSSGNNSYSTYDWTVNGAIVGHGISFTDTLPPSSGQYLICETINQQGCDATGPVCKYVASYPSGIDDIINATGVIIYPIPATKTIAIDIAELTTDEIEIFNDLGKKCADKLSESTQKVNLDLEAMPSGMYIAAIHLSDNTVIHKKFTIYK